MKALRQQAAGGAVLQPVKHVAHDAKARRHQAAGIARVHAFGQHLDLEHAGRVAAQAGGQPELVVVAGARVQADHQRHLAEPVFQRVDVGQQVVGAAFFTGLDQPDDARMGDALAFKGLHGGNAGIHRIAVVGPAPAIQPAVLVFRRPRTEVAAPAGELGLLVEVAIHQHGLGRAGASRRNFKKQHRRAAFKPDDFQPQAFNLLRLHPRRGIAHHGIDVAVPRPVRIERRRLGGNGDVVGQLLDNVAIPLGGDLGQRLASIENAGGNFTVQGGVHGGLHK